MEQRQQEQPNIAVEPSRLTAAEIRAGLARIVADVAKRRAGAA